MQSLGDKLLQYFLVHPADVFIHTISCVHDKLRCQASLPRMKTVEALVNVQYSKHRFKFAVATNALWSCGADSVIETAVAIIQAINHERA
jgi:hypothetical protein